MMGIMDVAMDNLAKMNKMENALALRKVELENDAKSIDMGYGKLYSPIEMAEQIRAVAAIVPDLYPDEENHECLERAFNYVLESQRKCSSGRKRFLGIESA